MAAAVFFTGPGQNHNTPAGLFEAYDLIKSRIGDGSSLSDTPHRSPTLTIKLNPTAAALIFALALICAGQTSSITVTLAGQIVSEGFIEWKVSVCIPNVPFVTVLF